MAELLTKAIYIYIANQLQQAVVSVCLKNNAVSRE